MCNSFYLAFLGVLLHLWPGTARASSTVTGFEGIPYVWDATSAKDAATYPGANGREKIQAAIDDRTGEEAVTVLVPAAGPDANGVWALDQALILPSNTTLLLDGSKLLLNTGANDNMIRNANPFAGGNTNIKIAGRNGAHLDGNAGGQRRGFWGERNDNSYRYFGIYLCDVDGFQILNLKIGPTHAWAIAPQACGNGLVSHIEFAQDGKSANQDGITSGRGIYNTTIRNLTGITYDDTVDIASTDESKFAHSSVVTDCYNILIENVVTFYSVHKCVKLVAGNGRTVRDIHMRNIRSLSSGYAIEIEGDWSSVKPTIDEMRNITIENVEVGAGQGVLVITSDCRDVTVRDIKATAGYGRIVAQAPGFRMANFHLENVRTEGAHNPAAGELFWFRGTGNQRVTIRNIQTDSTVKNLLRGSGASITGLRVDNVLMRGMTGVMFLAEASSDIRGTASNITLIDPKVPDDVYVQNMPDLELVNFLTAPPPP